MGEHLKPAICAASHRNRQCVVCTEKKVVGELVFNDADNRSISVALCKLCRWYLVQAIRKHDGF